MPKKLLLFALLFAAALTAGQAQNIQLEEDEPIGQMMERFAEINKARSAIQGWRVQILATPDRQKMETVKQSFQYRYPNIPIDWEHLKPYYKLRAGAFLTKIEAVRLKFILEQDYPGIYLVKDDNIAPEELISRY